MTDVDPLLGPLARHVRHGVTGEDGVALPPLCDHHVHLGLVEARAIVSGGVAAVLDLGGDPAVLSRLADAHHSPQIAYAGAFLTAPGGYPTDRDWAPDASVRAVPTGRLEHHQAGRTPAEAAVEEQHAFGASVVKVTLHVDDGPVFDADGLAEVVAAARTAGLPVVAHVQGAGMAERAIDAGVDAVAHTPWTERLDDALIARAVAAGQRWISTLDIHDRGGRGADHAVALDNLARFHAAGGTVLSGTDLGNGDLPSGVNPREVRGLLDAGLAPAEVLAAMTACWPVGPPAGVATWIPGPPPASAADVPDWLAGAHVVPAEAFAQHV
ncbi:amidohydrolase family protein [Agromyces sp. SYSU T00194]|uniref:amidohydrolase family protein n=1 Tax=Agromyces chitinivorans TaxID=3158560 RepID=UPI00339A54B9